MRLLTKTGLYFLFITPFIFIVSGVFTYIFLQNVFIEEVDEELENHRILLQREFSRLDNFQQFNTPPDSSIRIGHLGTTMLSSVINDTLIYSEPEQEYLPFRQMRFIGRTQSENRYVTIRRSKVENEDLIEGVFFTILIIYLVMITAFVSTNFLIVKKIWLPFKKTLNQIKDFSFSGHAEFTPADTNILEFKELNTELKKMTTKLTNDYNALKEFSQNASHEMQTPLAIIQAKLELIFQQPDLSEENLKALNSVYQAANRLSKLHSELSLLTRIENLEFQAHTRINLKNLIENLIENFTDIVAQKTLVLTLNADTDVFIDGNEYLLGIMFSNLFSNAIKHNVENGSIKINLNQTECVITNTGIAPKIPTAMLMERFRKGKASPESLGLGLSIVNEICKVHNFKINYIYENNYHTMQIFY